MRIPVGICCLFLGVIGCGSSLEMGDGGATDDLGTGGPVRDLASTGQPPDLAGPPPVPMCYETCISPSDCATSGVTLFNASHYACTAGRCDWRGCQSNSDCTAAYQKPNYACGSVPGSAVPTCYETCSAASDCATAGVALYSASHYACTTGRCAWQGCQASSDCTAAYQKANYTCQ